MRFKVHPGSPTRLGLILNYAIFKSTVQNDYADAIKMAEKGQADSVDKIEEMGDEEYREAKDLLEIYKENIAIWEKALA